MMWTSYGEKFARSSVQLLLLRAETSERARFWPALGEASPACTVSRGRTEETGSGTRSPVTGSDGPPPVTLTKSRVMGE